MARKSREQRLFGAACLKITLEQSGTAGEGGSIYTEALKDLDLTEAEVERYLSENRERVEAALAERGAI